MVAREDAVGEATILRLGRGPSRSVSIRGGLDFLPTSEEMLSLDPLSFDRVFVLAEELNLGC